MTIIDLPLDYPSILRREIAKGAITWQYSFNWLQSHGMSARIAREKLGEPKEG